jgi:hypothetical protein
MSVRAATFVFTLQMGQNYIEGWPFRTPARGRFPIQKSPSRSPRRSKWRIGSP